MERFPCDPTRECPLRDTIGCFEDVHHRQWPRRVYRRMGQIAMEFRNLDENKELTCRDRHNEIHATQPPPEVPTRQEMRQAVQRAMSGLVLQSTE